MFASGRFAGFAPMRGYSAKLFSYPRVLPFADRLPLHGMPQSLNPCKRLYSQERRHQDEESPHTHPTRMAEESHLQPFQSLNACTLLTSSCDSLLQACFSVIF